MLLLLDFFTVNMFDYTRKSKSIIFRVGIQTQQTHIIAFLTYYLLLAATPDENCIPVRHTQLHFTLAIFWLLGTWNMKKHSENDCINKQHTLLKNWARLGNIYFDCT